MEYKNSQYHLSNNREVWFANANSAIQRTQYYPSGLPWAEGTGANEQNRKYNGKEFIEMHGYDTYDFHARMYMPALARTTTMDPMAENYYSQSPYSFMGNNPILNIDPTGMFFDWFQNKITGDVYYNSEMRKGDENELGENWVHLGENGMFSDGTPMTNDITLLAQNKSLTNLKLKTDGSMSAEGHMKAYKAESFMNKQGYDLVPTQQTIYESESSSYFPTSRGKGITIISDAETRITEEVAYIKNNNMQIGKYNLTEIISNTNILLSKKVSRYKITYTDNAWKKFTTHAMNLSKSLSGTHDYRMKRTYKSWSQYPENNILINKFREKYGTK